VIHVMLPVQYLRRARAHRVEPQKRLMLAVLQTVIDDFQRSSDGRPASAAAAREARGKARAYLASTDRTWPFSFENICEAIGLDAHSVRAQFDQTDAST